MRTRCAYVLAATTALFYVVELVTLSFRMFGGPIGLGPPLSGLAEYMLIGQMCFNITLFAATLVLLAFCYYCNAIGHCRRPVRGLQLRHAGLTVTHLGCRRTCKSGCLLWCFSA